AVLGVRVVAVFPETPHRAVATVPDRLDTARRLQGDSLIVFAYPASRWRNRTWALSQLSVPGHEQANLPSWKFCVARRTLSNTRVALPLDLRHLTSNNIDLERSKSSYTARLSL